ncbi:MAG TPA: hypothetical protein VFV66_24560 [Nonomuraea sp.]|nr:hypothetical protein [Nonomuraea sp.]
MLYGRATETAAIAALLASARTGDGQALPLRGEAGVLSLLAEGRRARPGDRADAGDRGHAPSLGEVVRRLELSAPGQAPEARRVRNVTLAPRGRPRHCARSDSCSDALAG